MKKTTKVALIITLVVINILTTLGLVYYTVYKTANKPVAVNHAYAMVVGDVSYEFETERYSQVSIKNQSAENIVEYDKETKTITAKIPGTAELHITMPRANETNVFKVTVYAVGDGSSDNPFNLTRVEHLLNQSKHFEDSSKNFALRSDLDLSDHSSWSPLGTQTKPFAASVFGNGYSIVNMTINATAKNKSQYIEEVEGIRTLRVGFFGYTQGASEETPNQIKELGLKNATITTNDLQQHITKESIVLHNSFVGGLVAEAENTKITGNNTRVEIGLNSSISSNDTTIVKEIPEFTRVTKGVIGGVAGKVTNGQVSGIEAVVNIVSTLPVLEYSDKPYGSKVAGMVGVLINSKLEGSSVTGTINSTNFEETYVAGLVVYNQGQSSIKNCNVSDVNFVGKKVSDSRVSSALKMAGAVSLNALDKVASENHFADMQNIRVSGIVVDAKEVGQFSGLVTTNEANIKNSSFHGVINAYSASGFAFENMGEITFDDTFSGPAVDTRINTRTRAAGFIINHKSGTITGSETNKTKVVSDISLNISHLHETTGDEYKYMQAGFGINIESSISNFEVETKILRGRDIAGLFGRIQGKSTNPDIIIKNISLIASVTTAEGELEGKQVNDGVTTTPIAGTTNTVSGISKDFSRFAKLEDISIDIRVNKNIDQEKSYGLNIFAGMFASVSEDVKTEFELEANAGSNVKIIFDVFFNYAYDGLSTAKSYKAYKSEVGTLPDFIDSSGRVNKSGEIITDFA